jgi:hypothetical protein
VFGITGEKFFAGMVGLTASGVLALAIVVGSRNLEHFDAALVGYTFATLFATFGIAYRYAMWLQRPPTRLYWWRGWQVFLRSGTVWSNMKQLGRRLVVEIGANRFIERRGFLRWAAHGLIMWGCLLAAAITFPLVFGWIHFETAPGSFDVYRTYVMGVPIFNFTVKSLTGFLIFHGLVWASLLVIAGVMLAMLRRMRDHGAAAVQQFGEDFMPLILLFAISTTGLMLTASYTWMKGYGYDFLASLHAITVIFTLLWLPFGKFFHIFQRPAQLGVGFYKDAGQAGEQFACSRCKAPFASRMMVEDLIAVEGELGFSYQMDENKSEHYQHVCPRCRRHLFGLSQGGLWKMEVS